MEARVMSGHKDKSFIERFLDYLPSDLLETVQEIIKKILADRKKKGGDGPPPWSNADPGGGPGS